MATTRHWYFARTSAGFLYSCEHEHKTFRAARKCADRMTTNPAKPAFVVHTDGKNATEVFDEVSPGRPA